MTRAAIAMCEAALPFWAPSPIHLPALASPVGSFRTPSLNCRHASHADIGALPHAFHPLSLPQRRKGIKFANDNE